MGTNYYHLKAPITNVKPELLGDHVHVGIWINHGKAGELVMRQDEWNEFLRVITDNDRLVICTRYEDSKEGLEVGELETGLTPYTYIVSEYGDIETVQEIRGYAGAGRR